MSKVTKYWGNISLDALKEGIQSGKIKVKETEKYGKEVKCDLAMFEDGNISVSFYNIETKERINLGYFKVSKFSDDKQKPDSDLSW